MRVREVSLGCRGTASVAAVVATLALASPALGADGDQMWGWDGVQVAAPSSGPIHAQATDGAGGTIVAWSDGGIRVQRLNASGVALWGGGVQLSTSGSNPAIHGDGAGGAYVVWDASTGIFIQRVGASGTPQWTSGGVKVGTGGAYPAVVPDALGGAFIAWDDVGVRCAAVNSSGTPTAPGIDGISLGGAPVKSPGDRLRMVGDDTGGIADPGGVYVVWADAYNDVVAQRVHAGLPWGDTPIYVSADPRNEIAVEIAKDGAHGVLVTWAPYLIYPAERQVRVQRLNSAGSALWTAGGVVVVDSDDVGGNPDAWLYSTVDSDVTTDGAGGAIVAWSDWRHQIGPGGDDDIYAQRVNASGWPLWASGGVLLDTAMTGGQAGSQRYPRIASDGLGGAVVTIQDLGGWSWDVTANRIDENGKHHWSRIVFMDSISSGDPGYNQVQPSIVYDGTGPTPRGAIVAWVENTTHRIVAQKMELSPPENDPCDAAIPLDLGSFAGSTVGSTQDGAATCGGSSEVWYSYTSFAFGVLTATTCGTNDIGGTDAGLDTVLSVHAICPGTADNELPGGCNDDWSSSPVENACLGQDAGLARDSAVAVDLAPGQTAMIRVSRYGSTANGPFWLNLSFATAAAGRVPSDGMWSGVPLAISKNAVTPETLDLSWGPSCMPAATDYAVYEGRMSSYYSHTRKLCSTGGATSVTLLPGAGSTYYLVVPLNGPVEGSYGTTDALVERPRGGEVCVPEQQIGVCP